MAFKMRFILFLTLMACLPKTTRTPQPVHADDHAEIAKQVHKRINQIRRKQGLSKLKWKKPLAHVATAHSQDMGQRDYFDHNSPEGDNFQNRYHRANFECRVPAGNNQYFTGGENIHKTWRAAGTRQWSDGRQEEIGIRKINQIAEQAVEGWMNSQGHRENILTPEWQSEGIGVWIREDGAIFITQNFC
jgi:uncharacterized protein YkwD